MTINGWLQIALYCVLLTLLVKPLGLYMTRVFAGERNFLSPVLGPIERGLYRLSGVDERTDQHWMTYGIAMMFFSVVGFLVLLYGAVTTILADNGWIHLSIQQSQWLAAAGAIILGASKGLNVMGGLLGINAGGNNAQADA